MTTSGQWLQVRDRIEDLMLGVDAVAARVRRYEPPHPTWWQELLDVAREALGDLRDESAMRHAEALARETAERVLEAKEEL